jgi:hypothetical protein
MSKFGRVTILEALHETFYGRTVEIHKFQHVNTGGIKYTLNKEEPYGLILPHWEFVESYEGEITGFGGGREAYEGDYTYMYVKVDGLGELNPVSVAPDEDFYID